jgi:hypothetical protein
MPEGLATRGEAGSGPEACTESTDLLMRGFSRGGMVFITPAAVWASAA